VPGHSGYWTVAVPEPAVAELVAADIGTAVRPAAGATAVVAPALVDNSADTAADELVAEQQLEAAGKSVVLPGIEVVPEPAAGVRSIVAVVVGTAELDTERPGSAWESAERNSCPLSTSNIHGSVGTD
jgi:hypothetical protein